MKTIFKNNNRGKSTLYVLFALAYSLICGSLFLRNIDPSVCFLPFTHIHSHVYNVHGWSYYSD